MDERLVLALWFGLGVGLQSLLLIRGDWNWRRFAGCVGLGALGFMPGRNEHHYYAYLHILLCFGFFSFWFALLFKEGVLPLVSEKILLFYSMIFWFAFFALFAQSMPADAKRVREFVFECLANSKKPATIRRYVSTIGRAHRAAGVVDPTATETVKLSLKEMGRSVPARQTQARGLVWSEIAQFLEFDVRHLRDIRDRALVVVAYDTMCRREELVNLRIEDIESTTDGSGTVVIRRSKTDTAGEGATAYVSALSMRLVAEWLQASRRKSGTLFARVLGKGAAGDGFTAQNVTSVLRKVGRWIGLPAEEVPKISGHSCRVGGAQDLLALNIDLGSVMQAGRWKDTRMPMRYGEKVLAAPAAT